MASGLTASAAEPFSARAETVSPTAYGVVGRITDPLAAAPSAGLRPRVSVAAPAPPTARVAACLWRIAKVVAWQTLNMARALADPAVLASR